MYLQGGACNHPAACSGGAAAAGACHAGAAVCAEHRRPGAAPGRCRGCSAGDARAAQRCQPSEHDAAAATNAAASQGCCCCCNTMLHPLLYAPAVTQLGGSTVQSPGSGKWPGNPHDSASILSAGSLPCSQHGLSFVFYTQLTTKRTGHRRSSASAGPQPPTRPASPRLSLTARAADRARFDGDAARRAQQAEVPFCQDPSLAPSVLHLLQLSMVISAGVPSQQQAAASCAEQLRLRCALAVPKRTLHVPHRRSSEQRRRRVQSTRLPSWPPTARRSSSRCVPGMGEMVSSMGRGTSQRKGHCCTGSTAPAATPCYLQQQQKLAADLFCYTYV